MVVPFYLPVRVLISLHPCQHFSFSFFILVTVILVEILPFLTFDILLITKSSDFYPLKFTYLSTFSISTSLIHLLLLFWLLISHRCYYRCNVSLKTSEVWLTCGWLSVSVGCCISVSCRDKIPVCPVWLGSWPSNCIWQHPLALGSIQDHLAPGPHRLWASFHPVTLVGTLLLFPPLHPVNSHPLQISV